MGPEGSWRNLETMSRLQVFSGLNGKDLADKALNLNAGLLTDWLVKFLRDECVRKRGVGRAVFGLSGGVDSSVTAYLCAEAFGSENCVAVRMPYRLSSPDSLEHAQMIIDSLGLKSETVDITAMVDGYAQQRQSIDAHRIGNVCSRARMTILYDISAEYRALPIGTSNKTERFFGYYTWHGDDAPPVNPLGDLFKSQVFDLARHLGVPDVVVDKKPTADLVPGQSDEEDLGLTYETADRILVLLTRGYSPERIVSMGFSESDVSRVDRLVDSTHWKRHLPTVALLSNTAINEYYLRPTDYQIDR